ncbi:MAG: hypothetical protein AAB870_04520 [Patescibacteria group bacterium]
MTKGELILEMLIRAFEFLWKWALKFLKWLGKFAIKTPKHALISCVVGCGGLVYMVPSLLTPQIQSLLISIGIMSGLGWMCYLYILGKIRKAKKILGLGGKKKK